MLIISLASRLSLRDSGDLQTGERLDPDVGQVEMESQGQAKELPPACVSNTSNGAGNACGSPGTGRLTGVDGCQFRNRPASTGESSMKTHRARL